MLEIYVRELGAAEVLLRFPQKVRRVTAFLAAAFVDLLFECHQA